MLDCPGNNATKVLDVGSLIKQLYILWRFMGKGKATDSSFGSSKSFNRICPNHRFTPCGLSTHLHRHWCSWRHAAGELRTSLLGQITHSNKTRASPFPAKYMAKTLFTKTKKRFPLPREIRTGKNHQKPCSSCCPTFIKFTYHNLYRLPTNILEQTTPTAKWHVMSLQQGTCFKAVHQLQRLPLCAFGKDVGKTSLKSCGK